METELKELKTALLEVDHLAAWELSGDYSQPIILLSNILQKLFNPFVSLRILSKGNPQDYKTLKRYPGFIILDATQLPNSGAPKSMNIWIPNDQKSSFVVRFTTISKLSNNGLYCFPIDILKSYIFIQAVQSWISKDGKIVNWTQFGQTYKHTTT